MFRDPGEDLLLTGDGLVPDDITVSSEDVTVTCAADWPAYDGTGTAPTGDPVTEYAGAATSPLSFLLLGWSISQLDKTARLILAGADPLALLEAGDVAALAEALSLPLDDAQILQDLYDELQEDVNERARALALSKLVCLWWNTEQSAECSGDAIEDEFNPAVIAAGSYSSGVSQADADSQAVVAAASKLRCRWQNTEVTKTCADLGYSAAGLAPGGTNFPPGSSGFLAVTSVTVPAGTYTSTLSYSDAQEQAIAQALGGLVCFYINDATELSCGGTYSTSPVTYGDGERGNPVTVPAGIAGSFVSLSEANDLAETLASQYLDCFYQATQTAYCNARHDTRLYRIDGSLNTYGNNNLTLASNGSGLGLTSGEAMEVDLFTPASGACPACDATSVDPDAAILFLPGAVSPPSYTIGGDQYGQIARFLHAGEVTTEEPSCCKDPGTAIPYAQATMRSYVSAEDAVVLANARAAGLLDCTHTNWERGFAYCGSSDGAYVQDQLLQWRLIQNDQATGSSTEEANVMAESLALAARLCLPFQPWRIWWFYNNGNVDIGLIPGAVNAKGAKLECTGGLNAGIRKLALDDCNGEVTNWENGTQAALTILASASDGLYRVWLEIKCCPEPSCSCGKPYAVIRIEEEGTALGAETGVTYDINDVSAPGFYPIEAEQNFKEANPGEYYVYIGHADIDT